MLNKENRPTPSNDVPLYTFSDEVTKKKIRRHIKDITDVITEKDIKDVKVPGAETEPAPVKPKPGKKGKKSKNDVVNNVSGNPVDDVPGNPVTPWDILNE